MNTKRILFDELKKFHPDKDFVGGVISNVKTVEEQQKVINYIRHGDDVTIENIILLSLHLKNERTTQS